MKAFSKSMFTNEFVIARSIAKRAAILLTVFACFNSILYSQTASAKAQSGESAARLRIETLDRLTDLASETVNVELDEGLLKLVTPMLANDADDDPEDKQVKELIAGLKGVYVKSFTFGREGVYAESDIAPIREQLRAPGWSRVVEVRSRAKNENAEIYVMRIDGRVGGLAILSVEPKEITVVNIVGEIDFNKLSKLEGQFGVPNFNLERKVKDAPKQQ